MLELLCIIYKKNIAFFFSKNLKQYFLSSRLCRFNGSVTRVCATRNPSAAVRVLIPAELFLWVCPKYARRKAFMIL